MPDDKRLDLSQNLDGLLGDIAAAAKEVKIREDAERVKKTATVDKKKSKKIEMIIIAVAAVVLVFVAYFVVFSKPQAPIGQRESPLTNMSAHAKGRPLNGLAVMPSASPSPMRQPVQRFSNRPLRGSNQLVQHGYGRGEQAQNEDQSIPQ